MESVATVETHCKASPFPPRLGSLRLPHFPQPRRRIYLQTINPGGGSFLLDRGGLFLRCQSEKALWQGDYAHKGEYWSFPAATSVPKPLQKPHPPIWIAARSPDTYDFAVRHQCNILSWPLTRPMSEVELYKGHMEKALADNPGKPPPIFATMRHTVVYERKEDWEVPVKAAMRQFGQFENLFKNLGDVADGFPRTIDLSELENRGEYDPHMLHRNLMFGTPDEVITKLRAYEELGVDHFTYYASLGLGMKEQKRSMELFVKEVMPAFA